MKFLAFLSSAIKVFGSLRSVTSYKQYCTLRAFRQKRTAYDEKHTRQESSWHTTSKCPQESRVVDFEDCDA